MGWTRRSIEANYRVGVSVDAFPKLRPGRLSTRPFLFAVGARPTIEVRHFVAQGAGEEFVPEVARIRHVDQAGPYTTDEDPVRRRPATGKCPEADIHHPRALEARRRHAGVEFGRWNRDR